MLEEQSRTGNGLNVENLKSVRGQEIRNDLKDLEITKRRWQGYANLAVGAGHTRAHGSNSS